MTNLFLDLSGGKLRLILTEGYRLVDLWTLDAASEGEKPEKIIERVCGQVGQKIDHGHLILPEKTVKTESCKLQRMSLQDAEMVLSRQGGAPAASRIQYLTELAGPQHQMNCLNETVDRRLIESYKQAFDSANIKLKTILSPLQALIAAFTPLRQEMTNVEIVFHIAEPTITALFLSKEEILHHEKILVAEAVDNAMEIDNPPRSQKRRQFAVLTPLHSIYSNFMRENPEVSIDKIWVTGSFEGIEGVAESLTEATGLQVVLANHIADFDESSCAFTALAGLMRIKDDQSRPNFIPEDLLKTVRFRPQVLWYATAGFLIVLTLAVVGITESRLFGLKKQFSAANQELSTLELSSQMSKQSRSNLKFLSETAKSPVSFHEIFKGLANNLPPQLMLNGMRYQDDGNGRSLEISTVADYEMFQGDSSALSRLKGVLEQSTYLSDHKDPVIEILNAGEKKQVQITVSFNLSGKAGQ